MKKGLRNILRGLSIIVPLAIGLVVGFIGVGKIRQSKSYYIPPEPTVGSSGWMEGSGERFEAQTEKTRLMSSGLFISISGFVGIGLIGTIAIACVVFAATRTPEDDAEMLSKELKKKERYAKRLSELTGKNITVDDVKNYDTESDHYDDDARIKEQIYSEFRNNNASNTKAKASKYCAFCGRLNSPNATECSSCGAGFDKN